MSTSRRQTWFALAVLAVGVVFAVALGLHQVVTSNERPLHPDLATVPSVIRSTPAEKWAGAVKQSEQIVREKLGEQNLPGISAAVGIGGEIVWAEGFGYSNIETRELVDPDTRFRIGHVSKALTSAAVGLLREQGKLNLDDEIQEYVPAFPKKQWPVTTRQLMGHVAGFGHYRDTEWGDKPTVRCDRAVDGLKAFANDPLLFEPETRSSYSTYAWVLVSAAVEAVSGEPFFQFMRSRIFEPIGMSQTIADLANEPMTNRAISYYRANLGRAVTTNVDYSCFAGAGAFLSTPSDLVRFGIALSDGKFLQRDTVRLLQTRQLLASGAETTFGLGWMLDAVELDGQRTRVVGHASRTLEGASTSFLIFPDNGIIVAVTSNMSFADMRSVALSIAEAFKKAH